MDWMTFVPSTGTRSSAAGEDLLADYRQRRALEEDERAERKRLELANQHSILNAADARIRAWEKAHHLRMPSDPTHPVLSVIADATHLALAEVQEEQRNRAARSAPRTA